MAPGVAASPCRYALREARAIQARELGPCFARRSCGSPQSAAQLPSLGSAPTFELDQVLLIQHQIGPALQPLGQFVAILRNRSQDLSSPCLQQSEHFVSCDKISRRALDGCGFDGAFVEPELSQQFQDLSSGCIRSGPALSGPSNQIYAWKKHCWNTRRGRSKTTAAMARPSTSANSEATHQDRSASQRPRFLDEEVRKLAITAAAKGCVMKQRTAALPSWKPVLLTRGSTQTHSLLKSPTEFSVSRSKLASKNVRKKNFPGFEFRRHA